MTSQKTPYEIGLSMAGAVSAGAYSAGVLDFLVEALEKWYDAKEERPDEVPSHEVRLKVIAGSSAGGMTGVSAASALSGKHDPVTSLPDITSRPESKPDAPPAEPNKLYAPWVEQIDISSLLGDRDRSDPDDRVNSLLDSTILQEIAENALDFEPRKERREYLADPMHLLLTVANLKGVPYDISFKGAGDASHRMARQADYKEFLLTRADTEGGKALQLNPKKPKSPAWKQLQSYGLATGAFPGGLEPRHLKRDRSDYAHRKWRVPLRPDEAEAPRCWKYESITPSWPGANPSEEYRFLAVDGGAMNNEPIELARQKLAGGEPFIPRAPEKATSSVILVDPLPSGRITEGAEYDDIVSVLGALFDGLMNQARFKPDQLLLAQNSEIYSRYLIRPIRRVDDEKAKHPIASEMLSGFGGFLKKAFRQHDFQLGRRNCQRFLYAHFAIPREACDENPVFRHCDEEVLDEFSHGVKRESPSGEEEREVMPIVPLVGDVDPNRDGGEEKKVEWKDLEMSGEELGKIRRGVKRRTRVVLDSMIDQYTSSLPAKIWAKVGAYFGRGSIVDDIMDKTKEELEEFGLRE